MSQISTQQFAPAAVSYRPRVHLLALAVRVGLVDAVIARRTDDAWHVNSCTLTGTIGAEWQTLSGAEFLALYDPAPDAAQYLCQSCEPTGRAYFMAVQDEQLYWLQTAYAVLNHAVADRRDQLHWATLLPPTFTELVTGSGAWHDALRAVQQRRTELLADTALRFDADANLYVSAILDGALEHHPDLVDVIPPRVLDLDEARKAELAPTLARAVAPLWDTCVWWSTNRSTPPDTPSRLWVATAATGADPAQVAHRRRASPGQVLIRVPEILTRCDPTGSGLVRFGDGRTIPFVRGSYDSTLVDDALTLAAGTSSAQPAEDRVRNALNAVAAARL